MHRLSCFLLVFFMLAAGCTSPSLVDQSSRPQVLIIGDSLTMGLYASNEITAYRSELRNLLATRYPAQKWTISWEAVCTLAGLEQYWPTRALTPDVIFIELGTNDASGWAQCPQIPEAEWQQRFGAMLQRIRADVPNAVIIVGNIPWLGYDRYSRQKPIRYNSWILREAKRLRIPVANLWQATVERQDSISRPDQHSTFGPGYKGDNFHPNDLGHSLIANSFFDAYTQQRR